MAYHEGLESCTTQHRSPVVITAAPYSGNLEVSIRINLKKNKTSCFYIKYGGISFYDSIFNLIPLFDVAYTDKK
jgi:hypothetical protein